MIKSKFISLKNSDEGCCFQTRETALQKSAIPIKEPLTTYSNRMLKIIVVFLYVKPKINNIITFHLMC